MFNNIFLDTLISKKLIKKLSKCLIKKTTIIEIENKIIKSIFSNSYKKNFNSRIGIFSITIVGSLTEIAKTPIKLIPINSKKPLTTDKTKTEIREK